MKKVNFLLLKRVLEVWTIEKAVKSNENGNIWLELE